MRAIVVMYDSLNRRMLPPYADTDAKAPNFERLAQRSTTFENCYAGSMPCMPARRELHTGRHNFLHRSWGPIEPFDDSVPEMLKQSGVYTHLVTDHQHYWEDGGGTYHNRFNSYEFFRGQEGDLWKGHVDGVEAPPTLNSDNALTRQDWINRLYLTDESDHPQTLTFDAGLHFLETNRDADDWMIQIETFDPHEPFFSYAQYRELYGDPDPDVVFDWPAYRRVVETDAQEQLARDAYFALLTMCDRSLGRVLDVMDSNAMWDDTMLIVCTDHGFMLGERGWWGKSVQPWYDETIHTPLFIWDPRVPTAGERRQSLVQTIDLGPTLLEFFDRDRTADMQGRPLRQVLENDEPVREAAIFGAFGGHVSVTDGRYVYMRANAEASNAPLLEHTLMPTHMRSRFSAAELHGAELVDGFSFTKGAPVLRMPGWALGDPSSFGTLLFDLEEDPEQSSPLADADLELRMMSLLVDVMRADDAPPSQYARLGLPASGPVGAEHALIEKQWDSVERSAARAVRFDETAPDALVATVPVRELAADEERWSALVKIVPQLEQPVVRYMFATAPLLQAVAAIPGVGAAQLAELEAVLSRS